MLLDEYYLRLVDHQQGKISSFFQKILFGGIKTMTARHKIASNIQGIKSKVEVILRRRPIIPDVASSSSQRFSTRLDSQGDVEINFDNN
jgi:disease resistance protein RPM1